MASKGLNGILWIPWNYVKPIYPKKELNRQYCGSCTTQYGLCILFLLKQSRLLLSEGEMVFMLMSRKLWLITQLQLFPSAPISSLNCFRLEMGDNKCVLIVSLSLRRFPQWEPQITSLLRSSCRTDTTSCVTGGALVSSCTRC